MQNRLKIIFIILSLWPISIFGQIGTSSPYTRYGVGDLFKNSFGTSRAMGGIYSSMRSQNEINYKNPASYSSQDTLSFLFDFGLFTKMTEMETTVDAANFHNTSFDHLAFAIPISKWMNISTGVVPYSTVGYNIETRTQKEYFPDIIHYHYGNGGYNQFYLGASIELFKQFSIGFNYLYTFGDVEHNSLTYLDTTESFTTASAELYKLSASSFSIGVQYYNTFNNNLQFSVGAVYEHQNNLGGEFQDYTIVTNGSLAIDTLNNTLEDTYAMTVPNALSVGFSLGKKNKWKAGIDYRTQDWSGTMNGSSLFNEYNSIGVGFEYVPDFYSLTNYFARIRYRIGGFYENDYISFNGEDLIKYGLTFGFGIPIAFPYTTLNVGCEIGKRGTTDNGLIEENYALFSFNLVFYDIWFVKRKYH